MFYKTSRLWLNSVALFDPVQHFFNGEFWPVVSRKFKPYLQDKVLDLACGTGELADYIHPKSYLGVDLNDKYIFYARSHRKQKTFLIGDITQLSLREKFDTIAFIGSAHHLSDQQLDQLCRYIKRLKPKNFLVVDGIPKPPLTSVLKFLDAKLGDGKYFREEPVLVGIFSRYFKVVKHGAFNVVGSFYYYPYLVATTTKP